MHVIKYYTSTDRTTNLKDMIYDDKELPKPFAYFPLVDELVGSYDGAYDGDSRNIQWVNDDRFGIVPYCNGVDINQTITLKSVPYYSTGKFAINFWFKSKNVRASDYRYILSHTSKAWIVRPCQTRSGVKLDANQIGVFLGYDGLINAVMKDNNDVLGDTYLYARESVSEQDWHMVTLTTRPDGRRGYQFFVDGELTSELDEAKVYYGGSVYYFDVSRNAVVNVDGGDDISLDADITLCGRSDFSPSDTFNGSVVHLLLYNTSLTREEVSHLHNIFTAQWQTTKTSSDYPNEVVRDSDDTGVSSNCPVESCEIWWDFANFDRIGTGDHSSRCCKSSKEFFVSGVLECFDYQVNGWCDFLDNDYCCQECNRCVQPFIIGDDDRVSFRNKNDLLPYMENSTNEEGFLLTAFYPQEMTPSILSEECTTQFGKFVQVDGANISADIPATHCYPFSTIGRVQVYYEGVEKPSSCTGTVISSRTILTAAHCIYVGIISYQTNVSSIVFTPGQFEQYKPFGSYESVQFSIPHQYMNDVFSYAYDYATVTFEDPLGLQTGWLGIDFIDCEELLQEDQDNYKLSTFKMVYLAGYPSDKNFTQLWFSPPVRTIIDTCENDMQSGWFYHEIDTQQSNSGSPIFFWNKLYGMHIGADFLERRNRGIYMSAELLKFLRLNMI
eukprot:TRINITY_DN655_c0_g4_i1.p1 TRINITY_DN655_c0_g4~~TRINITY_DN655_c0_g4_i1.p1  ORF type:complete len:734 (+),score=37.77 TRINITY_DN655_c0_g4_i1:196-2202(+)